MKSIGFPPPPWRSILRAGRVRGGRPSPRPSAAGDKRASSHALGGDLVVGESPRAARQTAVTRLTISVRGCGAFLDRSQRSIAPSCRYGARLARARPVEGAQPSKRLLIRTAIAAQRAGARRRERNRAADQRDTSIFPSTQALRPDGASRRQRARPRLVDSTSKSFSLRPKRIRDSTLPRPTRPARLPEALLLRLGSFEVRLSRESAGSRRTSTESAARRPARPWRSPHAFQRFTSFRDLRATVRRSPSPWSELADDDAGRGFRERRRLRSAPAPSASAQVRSPYRLSLHVRRRASS